jgi:hypothetical protein
MRQVATKSTRPMGTGMDAAHAEVLSAPVALDLFKVSRVGQLGAVSLASKVHQEG